MKSSPDRRIAIPADIVNDLLGVTRGKIPEEFVSDIREPGDPTGLPIEFLVEQIGKEKTVTLLEKQDQ